MQVYFLLHLAVTAAALRVTSIRAPRVASIRAPRACAHTVCVATDEDGDKGLDQPDAEGAALMREFNARLDREGGATQFKIKSAAKDLARPVSDASKQVGRVAEDAADAAAGAVNKLPPNLLPILAVIVVLSIIPPLISSLAGGGGGGMPSPSGLAGDMGSNYGYGV